MLHAHQSVPLLEEPRLVNDQDGLSLVQAQRHVIETGSEAGSGGGQQGFHASAQLATVSQTPGLRTYIPEPKRTMSWKWGGHTAAERRAITANRRRMRAEGVGGCSGGAAS